MKEGGFEFIDDMSVASGAIASLKSPTTVSSVASGRRSSLSKGSSSGRKKRRNSVTIVEEPTEKYHVTTGTFNDDLEDSKQMMVEEVGEDSIDDLERELNELKKEEVELIGVDEEAEKIKREETLTELKTSKKQLNRMLKQTAKFERFLIRKKLWKKEWQIHGRTTKQTAGFTMTSRDPKFVINALKNKASNLLLIELSKMAKRTAYASYMIVFIFAGEEAAQSMGLRDFLLKRSLTPEEMITAASDGERPIVLRGLTQIKGRVPADARNYAGYTALMSCIEASTKQLTNDELRDWDRSQRRQQKIR